MSKVYSGYCMADKTKIYYEVLDDGFDVFIGESLQFPSYHQPEPFIPNPNLSYEENALAMCKSISDSSMNAKDLGKSIDDRLTKVEANLDYLMLLSDAESAEG